MMLQTQVPAMGPAVGTRRNGQTAGYQTMTVSAGMVLPDIEELEKLSDSFVYREEPLQWRLVFTSCQP